MIDSQKLDPLPVAEKWEVLSHRFECPEPLLPFVGSRLAAPPLTRSGKEFGDENTVMGVLIVELRPGMTFHSVCHLSHSLDSFFRLPLGSISIETISENARRVRVLAWGGFRREG